jgi:hypothetical protein
MIWIAIVTLIDLAGREWRLYDFQVIAGKTSRLPFGQGQYRGFVPVDGGARRTFLLMQADRDRGTSREVLLEQLAAAAIYHRDDPAKCAVWGAIPERIDPTAMTP